MGDDSFHLMHQPYFTVYMREYISKEVEEKEEKRETQRKKMSMSRRRGDIHKGRSIGKMINMRKARGDRGTWERRGT